MSALDADRAIGGQLRILRGGTSQTALAAEMRSHGLRWSQTTVWQVEQGERPVRLSEALVLDDLFPGALSILAGKGEAGGEVEELVRLRRTLAQIRRLAAADQQSFERELNAVERVGL